MAVLYKLYQDNRKNSEHKGEWYGRAIQTNTIGTQQLADIIQRNCTAKRSDVLAVITELVEVMRNELQASHRVKLDGFGSFKIGIKTHPAKDASEFSVTKNVHGLHVNFTPEVKIAADKSRQIAFLSGCSVQEAPKNAIDTSKKKDEPTPEPQNP